MNQNRPFYISKITLGTSFYSVYSNIFNIQWPFEDGRKPTFPIKGKPGPKHQNNQGIFHICIFFFSPKDKKQPLTGTVKLMSLYTLQIYLSSIKFESKTKNTNTQFKKKTNSEKGRGQNWLREKERHILNLGLQQFAPTYISSSQTHDYSNLICF